MTAAIETTTPTLDIDLFSDETLNDPWPAFKTIRDAAAAVHITNPLYDVYAVGRFDDVRTVTRDWHSFSSAGGVGFSDIGNEMSKGVVVGCDPPLHDELRTVMIERLSVSQVRGVEHIIQSKVDSLIGGLVDRGSFDGVKELAAPLVSGVFGELLGIPDAVIDQVAPAGEAVFNSVGPANQRFAEAVPILMNLIQMMQEVTKHDMVEGSLGWALYDAAERDELPPEWCTQLLFNYVGPGFETTIDAIGNALWLLGSHPDQWDLLKKDPSLIPSAVNEVLRIEAPIQTWGRVTTRDVDISGATIPQGARLAVLFGSANRDERKYADPERFDVTRNPADHVSFGHGIHLCLGAALAKAELIATLTALTSRVTSLEIGQPVRRLNNTARGLGNLPVTVTI